MRIITDSDSINTIREKAPAMVEDIEREYAQLCTSAKGNFFQRLSATMKYPHSLRCFDEREYLLKGEQLERAVLLRQVWHDIWALGNMMPNIKGLPNNVILSLDHYDTECMLRLSRYTGIEINTYVSDKQ